MSIKRKIYEEITTDLERIKLFYGRRGEIKKFEDKRRRDIWESVHLSKEQEQEIDTFYFENYGKKIPYTWHRHYTAFTGKFDVKYFPELLYIPEFEYYMNSRREYVNVFQDKNFLPILAQHVGVKMPVTFYAVANGCPFWGDLSRLDNIGDAFIKPTIDSCSGEGCRKVRFRHGKDEYTGETVKQILSTYGKNFVVQEKINCEKSISELHPNSVNSFRVITYRWGERIYHTPITMKIGCGGNYLDNAHAGGIIIAIDDEGNLGERAFSEFKEVYTEHPNTGIIFKGYKISHFDKIISATYKMHEYIPWIGIINWDITLNKEGDPLVIEGNMGAGSIWYPQMTHGCGPFGENTADILQWLKFLRTLPFGKRKEYQFGDRD